MVLLEPEPDSPGLLGSLAEARATVACRGVRGADCGGPRTRACWRKPFWRRLPLPLP